MDAGYLKEFNEPYNLLRCRNSLLYQLVAQTGHSEAQKLFDIARKKYHERHPKKAMPASESAEDEMGALEEVEQDDDEGVEVKSVGESNGKKSDDGADDKEEEKVGAVDDEKAQLLVGFKPDDEEAEVKDDKA